MPATISLGSMYQSVLRRANIENLVSPTNSVLVQSEIKEYLNESLAELFDLLVAARGQEFFRKSFQFNTNSNQSLYRTPDDFYESISIDINLGGNLFITARPYMESERNAARWNASWTYATPIFFRLLGVPDSTGANLQPTMINFIPSPSSNFTCTLNYIPSFRAFATDGTEDANVFDGINGWEAFAIWNATAICLEKLKQDSSFARAQVERIKVRIEGLAPDRHAGDAERVHDVDTVLDGIGLGFGAGA